MSELYIEPECCPPFDPTPWDKQTFVWEQRLFIKERVLSLFNIPINFGQVMKKQTKLVESSGCKNTDNLSLSNHNSKFGMDVYYAVDKPVSSAQNEQLSGTFYSKVYEGSFKEINDWKTDFVKRIGIKEKEIEDLYYWYTTCPKCAKKYEKNYVVLHTQAMPFMDLDSWVR